MVMLTGENYCLGSFLFQQDLANASGICLSSAVRASMCNLLDEFGGEGWTLQNYNCNEKKLSHTVTSLGPCNAVIWFSLLSDLDISKFIIRMRVKGGKKGFVSQMACLKHPRNLFRLSANYN